MHTESCFNPRARSYVPAYGLMQIVPHTAGVDSYKFLYKIKKIPSSTYLYNSTNNIKLGSAYLHILYYNYLKDIKNPISRLYCTIAAYNTGAGNVAWAFTHKYNVKKASKIINKLTPNEVYQKLLQNLKYDEPKHYLKKVTKRMDIYHKLYKG
jgi:membrane-bound lytic murein transglycosylase C